MLEDLCLRHLTYTFLFFTTITRVYAAPPLGSRGDNNPLNLDWDPAPAPEDGPPISAGALRDKTYLPAQIGGIVGAYAVSLVLVAIALLSLAKTRRDHFNAGNEEADFETKALVEPTFILNNLNGVPLNDIPASPVPNFSYPPRIQTNLAPPSTPGPYIYPSPTSTIGAPGVSPLVDQRIVAADRIMAQSQLEDMYKHVMEHEDAKQRGITLESPVLQTPASQRAPAFERQSTTSTLKKERNKPQSLNLSEANDDKPRKSSLLSALRSPKKKPKGVTISSPIMTPQSATFPRYHHESQEVSAIAPRHYAPPPPPPIPTDNAAAAGRGRHGAPPTPGDSPRGNMSIDERLSGQHHRTHSQAPTEGDESATSEHSQVPLMGLPSSPRRPSQLPSLPASPRPGSSFSRPNAPSAVRTGGALPLRAYEPSISSPTTMTQTTKQTVFERKGPLSPDMARTPGTAVPYTPYQPFTPCVPVTPSLVTKEERKRMRRMVPKTPTLEMVRSEEDVW